MRQDVHPSIRRPSVLQFFLSLARRPRENLFRSSHSLCGGGHFLCANYFPFGITSRPLPLFQSLPTGRRTDIPPRWNCFSRPVRCAPIDRPFTAGQHVYLSASPHCSSREERGGSLRGREEEEEIDETN